MRVWLLILMATQALQPDDDPLDHGIFGTHAGGKQRMRRRSIGDSPGKL